MKGLHGVQQRYLPELLQNGFSRDSAAFFLIPEEPDPETLRLTLACAVFHAIGLSVWREAAQSGQTVAQVMRCQDLALVFMDEIPQRDTLWEYYRAGGALTYPYTKIRAFGPVHTGRLSVMRLEAAHLDHPIAAPGAPEQLRFFQKTAGKPQYLSGVDMQAVEQMCLRAAGHLLRTCHDMI